MATKTELPDEPLYTDVRKQIESIQSRLNQFFGDNALVASISSEGLVSSEAFATMEPKVCKSALGKLKYALSSISSSMIALAQKKKSLKEQMPLALDQIIVCVDPTNMVASTVTKNDCRKSNPTSWMSIVFEPNHKTLVCTINVENILVNSSDHGEKM